MSVSPAKIGTGFSGLPMELCVKILQLLPLRDLLTCLRVSSHLRALIRETSALQYIFELSEAGLQDNPLSRLDLAAKRALLQGYHHISRSLNSLKAIDMQQPPLHNSTTIPKVAGCVMAQMQDHISGAEIHFLRFASSICNIAEKRWSIQLSTAMSTMNTIVDFFFDPGQDLLVVVLSLEMRFLTMSAGTVHPLTPKEAMASIYPMHRALIKTGGQYICALCASDSNRQVLIAWNWLSHKVVLMSRYAPTVIKSFAFVDQDHLMIAGVAPDNLRQRLVWHVQDLRDTSCHARLLFPPWFGDHKLMAMMLHDEPVASCCQTSEIQHSPFLLVPPDRLIVLEFHLSGSENAAIVTLSSRLLACLENSPGRTKQIAWEQWVPRNTRLVPAISVKHLVSGAHMIAWNWGYFETSNFNESRFHPAMADTERREEMNTDSDPKHIFAVPLRTMLPFIKRKFRIRDGAMGTYEPIAMQGDSVLFRSWHLGEQGNWLYISR